MHSQEGESLTFSAEDGKGSNPQASSRELGAWVNDLNTVLRCFVPSPHY